MLCKDCAHRMANLAAGVSGYVEMMASVHGLKESYEYAKLNEALTVFMAFVKEKKHGPEETLPSLPE